jgi:hypothetical protein
LRGLRLANFSPSRTVVHCVVENHGEKRHLNDNEWE